MIMGKKSGVPKWVWWISPLIVVGVAAKLLNQNPPVNAAQTSPESADAALRTRIYHAPWNAVVDAAQSVLKSQKTYGRAWRSGQNSIKGAEPGAKLRETLRVQVPVFVFTDDLEVTISEAEDGQIRVDCASKARIGRGDFGENRRHVVQFLRALDVQLPQ
ncbi:Protein of unknown function (DUF1499) [Abditibacterium utsteinense]|uniref:DUF1499 domain-containing protein n=1 Tax=Abditibacterium utsteinense TaxID=1960156 RepID=A0A2S8SR50_9BACT|nr:DUF1499 domain-containing protein [Abditibacterium utsteinense]PQV63256.1 Protein of unknown function (DUF1499) [Abditibacterium utsteinense]